MLMNKSEYTLMTIPGGYATGCRCVLGRSWKFLAGDYENNGWVAQCHPVRRPSGDTVPVAAAHQGHKCGCILTTPQNPSWRNRRTREKGPREIE